MASNIKLIFLTFHGNSLANSIIIDLNDITYQDNYISLFYHMRNFLRASITVNVIFCSFNQYLNDLMNLGDLK